jgi:hypothetical protein
MFRHLELSSVVKAHSAKGEAYQGRHAVFDFMSEPSRSPLNGGCILGLLRSLRLGLLLS